MAVSEVGQDGTNSPSNQQGPLWVPTLAIKRMMRECRDAGPIMEISSKVLEGLLFDVLQHRQERIEQQISGEPSAPETTVDLTPDEEIRIGQVQGELAVLKKDARAYNIRRIAGQALEVVTLLRAKMVRPTPTENGPEKSR